MSPIIPPLAERERPGLSETLRGPRYPGSCQACGRWHSDNNPVARWLEHDAWDRLPSPPVVVVLCRRCSGLLIEPHARLYRELDKGESFPGCMGICVDCRFRVGVACTHAVAQVNGGPGLEIGWEKPPVRVHLCRSPRRLSGFQTLYSGPVISCSGRKPVVVVGGS